MILLYILIKIIEYEIIKYQEIQVKEIVNLY